MGLFKSLFGKRADHNRRYRRAVRSGKLRRTIPSIMQKVRATGGKKGGVTRGFFG